MATSLLTHLESDGKALQVTLSYPTENGAVAYVEGWLGISQQSGNSGDMIALEIVSREWQFSVPTALAVAKGETVYVDTAAVDTHTPPDAAYSKTAGSGKIALFKATSAQDANDVVTGILLPVNL